ncbi:AMP-binding protein [Pyxidicoccus sp. 3LG]
MPPSAPRNMTDYEATRRDFRWERPEHFNFATDVVDRHARERPDALALLWSDEAGRERRFTWEDVRRHSLHAARFLTGQGLRQGERVFIIMPRVPEWWFLVLGSIRAGIVFMPGTPMLTVKDIRYRLEAASANAGHRRRGLAWTASRDWWAPARLRTLGGGGRGRAPRAVGGATRRRRGGRGLGHGRLRAHARG